MPASGIPRCSLVKYIFCLLVQWSGLIVSKTFLRHPLHHRHCCRGCCYCTSGFNRESFHSVGFCLVLSDLIVQLLQLLELYLSFYTSAIKWQIAVIWTWWKNFVLWAVGSVRCCVLSCVVAWSSLLWLLVIVKSTDYITHYLDGISKLGTTQRGTSEPVPFEGRFH